MAVGHANPPAITLLCVSSIAGYRGGGYLVFPCSDVLSGPIISVFPIHLSLRLLIHQTAGRKRLTQLASFVWAIGSHYSLSFRRNRAKFHLKPKRPSTFFLKHVVDIAVPSSSIIPTEAVATLVFWRLGIAPDNLESSVMNTCFRGRFCLAHSLPSTTTTEGAIVPKLCRPKSERWFHNASYYLENAFHYGWED